MRIIITGGGTGGHLFPGIAVAQAMQQRFPDGKVMFVSTDRSIDNQALRNLELQKESISCLGIKGKSLLGTLQAMVRLPLSLWQAIKIVKGFKPNLVLGVGGYVTGPVVLAAKIMGIKTCIHEQNSVPGITNRILGKMVNRIYTSIPGSEKFFAVGKTVLTGNPVRREILAVADQRPAQSELKTMLVLGGSQGAHQVNKLVVEALAAAGLPAGFSVIHQTGVKDEEWVRNAYAQEGIKAEVAAFIDDMAAAYAKADFVVSRAGATTLAELTATGKPVIFIPYPYAADNHQVTNAQFLVVGGAAVMFEESGLTAAKLQEQIEAFLNDAQLLGQMGKKMRTFAKPGATQSIVDESVRLLNRV
ncbi:MAG: undecaprenyldiphospho-muramoylpentapeptide beta-N-acetylglucosaminyltransferase [Desulfobulbaceae bacterium]|nr:undecaprenyldiphospho-muramoylpentapeptide beta-N-acetylglucosaminyltransferase [Desulfobulbaceae bacterium]HIJ79349.1 undecaprenyldiphospho-muramoylpentapeptide beta-N-acetylglucosaminyltransferase [Deltaproteobacteria bacterium]